ncbi:MAG TPA: ABC transporter ATP-binding protein [Cellulomonas sp.]
MSVPLELTGASLAYGSRTVWSGLDLTVRPGDFVTVLGPNGSGKTSLLRAVLGLHPLTAGRLTLLGRPAVRGNQAIGYVPQQRQIDTAVPVRARDLVALGLDGHRWGLGRRHRARVDDLLAAVGADVYADAPLSALSGGEQQRVRIAQALACEPALLLCDEPLASLDLRHQRDVTALIADTRRTHGTAVVFVTHEITPVLPYTDTVLYLAPGGHAVGAPDEVLTSAQLTRLYGTPVDVLHVQGRIVIVGTDETVHHATPERA